MLAVAAAASGGAAGALVASPSAALARSAALGGSGVASTDRARATVPKGFPSNVPLPAHARVLASRKTKLAGGLTDHSLDLAVHGSQSAVMGAYLAQLHHSHFRTSPVTTSQGLEGVTATTPSVVVTVTVRKTAPPEYYTEQLDAGEVWMGIDATPQH